MHRKEFLLKTENKLPNNIRLIFLIYMFFSLAAPLLLIYIIKEFFNFS